MFSMAKILDTKFWNKRPHYSLPSPLSEGPRLHLAYYVFQEQIGPVSQNLTSSRFQSCLNVYFARRANLWVINFERVGND